MGPSNRQYGVLREAVDAARAAGRGQGACAAVQLTGAQAWRTGAEGRRDGASGHNPRQS
ncbi:hypothetical protein ACUJ8N_22780 [Streptomyces sp. ESR1.13]|uniref:hypothetical protein n=1 Tax=unclassified Streptomyces TaxID=2593676 RepID=UPI000AAE126A|nr:MULTISPECIES: hypothetical protein [unclassified Streptomyces]